MAGPKLARTKLLEVTVAAIATAIDQLAASVEPYLGKLYLQSTEIKGIEFSASTEKQIAHKLGRAPQGWRFNRIVGTAGGDFSEVTSDERTITIYPSSDCTADLEVW